MKVDQIINEIIRVEGGYVNDPADLGGATKYGITEKVARENGYTGSMSDLPKEVAFDIYLKRYWLEPRFDAVAKLSEAVAEELCDTGVNCGVPAAKPMLQRALNLLNREQKDYVDLVVDGQLGQGTLLALAKYLSKRGAEGEKVLLKTLNILQGYRYIEITEKRPANETFFYGWVANRIGV